MTALFPLVLLLLAGLLEVYSSHSPSLHAGLPDLKRRTLVLVDGVVDEPAAAFVKKYCSENDISLIKVLSPSLANELSKCGRSLAEHIVPTHDNVEEWLEQPDLDADAAVCCLSCSEQGLSTVELLSSMLGLDGASAPAELLSSKFAVSSVVAKRGLPFVQQALHDNTWKEVRMFLNELWLQSESMQVVVQADRGSGRKWLCSSFAEVEAAAAALRAAGQDVLVQEYVGGQEYIVDTVVSAACLLMQS